MKVPEIQEAVPAAPARPKASVSGEAPTPPPTVKSESPQVSTPPAGPRSAPTASPSAKASSAPRGKESEQTPSLGRYEIVAKLGEGGMGKVYQARHKTTGQIVALKVLRPSLARKQQFVERFYREARAAAALKHPNLVGAIEVGESNGFHFFAMEYVEGATLLKVIEKQGAIPEAGALTIAHQVASVLDTALQQRIVHRDIKPENLMVMPDRSMKLMDMGLAKEQGDDHDTKEISGGGIVGTPMYASPEQVRGEKDLDVRSDIYSLGLTLYHAVTGELPYQGATAALIMAKQLNEPLTDPRRKNPNLSLNFVMMLKRMTEKDRERRYQTPQELLHAIRNCRERLAERQAREEEEKGRKGR
ncbi:MAG: serine/threonine protein kinase [Planctomycetes bacterium]|nr:serine/threonine protein kinase [Planctomycetota bacterium]